MWTGRAHKTCHSCITTHHYFLPVVLRLSKEPAFKMDEVKLNDTSSFFLLPVYKRVFSFFFPKENIKVAQNLINNYQTCYNITFSVFHWMTSNIQVVLPMYILTWSNTLQLITCATFNTDLLEELVTFFKRKKNFIMI